jgi:hypothetical protein
MKYLDTLSHTGNRVRKGWNTHPRLRVGVIIIVVWFAATPVMRSFNQLFYIKWGSVGLLSIGVAFAIGGIASIVGAWRTADWPDVDDNDEWVDGTPSKPTPTPKDLRDEYDYGGPETFSHLEFEGKAVSWALFLWWIAFSLLFAIILWRPAPSPLTLEGVALLGFVGAIIVGMVLIHEGLHGLAARIHGADVSFGLSASGPYTEYTNVVLSRRENILILAAPLLVLTPVSVAAALLANGLLVYAGVTVLLFNTACSCGDLYQIGYRLYCPPRSQVYFPSDGPPHLYALENQSQQSLLSRLDTSIAWVGALFTIPPLRSEET